MNTISIDCRTCAVRGPACGDCVMAVLLEPESEVTLDSAERRALGALSASGLVPPLRLVQHSPRAARRRAG